MTGWSWLFRAAAIHRGHRARRGAVAHAEPNHHPCARAGGEAAERDGRGGHHRWRCTAPRRRPARARDHRTLRLDRAGLPGGRLPHARARGSLAARPVSGRLAPDRHAQPRPRVRACSCPRPRPLHRRARPGDDYRGGHAPRLAPDSGRPGSETPMRVKEFISRSGMSSGSPPPGGRHGNSPAEVFNG